MADLKEYVAKFRAMNQYQEMFFVTHTLPSELRDYTESEKIPFLGSNEVHFLGLEEVASLVVDFGLCQWLMQKAS